MHNTVIYTDNCVVNDGSPFNTFIKQHPIRT